MASHYRSVDPEELRGPDTPQDGDGSVGTACHKVGRLVNFLRPGGCVPTGSSSSPKAESTYAFLGRQFTNSGHYASVFQQVFTRMMVPASKILHDLDILLLLYLDD